jgi:hypothetical protein
MRQFRTINLRWFLISAYWLLCIEAISRADAPIPTLASSEASNPWTALATPANGTAAPSAPLFDTPQLNGSAASLSPCADHECCQDGDEWCWQTMPQGIIYQSYWAGTKEPRFATYWNHNTAMGQMWDTALGGRIGLVRYGNRDPNWPEGWQGDMEGAVFPRLDPQGESTPLIGDDYRFGLLLTRGGDHWEFKIGYYHISAHLGDEYILYVNPAADRINYVRDSFIVGAGYFLGPECRIYGEIGYAAVDGGAEPLEFQFGFEWANAAGAGFRGGPFFAVNTDLRQEVDFGGTFSVQVGWMWRQFTRGSNLRIGGQYVCGKSDEFEFFKQNESRIGWGLWCDF